MTSERHLSEDSASLRALIDTIVDGVIIIDSNGIVRVFNPASEKLFGYRGEEVIGRNVSMLMPEPYRSEHDRYLDAYRLTGERKIIGTGREVVGLRKDGSTFPMELSVGETNLPAGHAYVGIIRDISRRKKSEEALKEARDNAIASRNAQAALMMELNHRVRNNLTLILSIMRLQHRRIANPATRDVIESLLRRVEAIGVVQNLMFEAEAFGVVDREMLQKIAQGVCGAFDPLKVDISVNVAPEFRLPAGIAMPLTMIITELLLNAFKHAFDPAHSDARVEVDLQNYDGQAILAVRDNGKGLDRDKLGEGAMGSWLVQLLAQQISATVDYRIEGGTAVTVRFPVPTAAG